MKNKISCNVIGDLLPLYVDEVLSNDSKEIVEEHLSKCESCRENAEKMGKTLVISNDTDSEKIKKLKKRVSVKKIIASGLLVLMILFGLSFYLFYYGNAVSYDDVLVISGFYKDEASMGDSQAYLGQGWVINFDLKSGKGLEVIKKNNYKTNENGEKIYVGRIFELREIPINIFDESSGFTYGYSYSVYTPDKPNINPSEIPDETLTVIYKDKTVVYSMREEGLFKEQNPDKNFKYYQEYYKNYKEN